MGELDKDDGATIFFIVEKQQRTISKFYLDSLIETKKYKQWEI